jgi:hypothetical protein
MFGFGIGIVQSLSRGVPRLSPVIIKGGALSVQISNLPQISKPVVTGGVLQVTKSTPPKISDIRTR